MKLQLANNESIEHEQPTAKEIASGGTGVLAVLAKTPFISVYTLVRDVNGLGIDKCHDASDEQSCCVLGASFTTAE